jgi:CheY-like chemotaxis protein
VQGIVHASERAGELTRQLLAFSSRQMLQPKVIDLNHVALDMESMLRRLIPSDIELVLDCDPRITSVLADPSQLEQVILNLVVNARDAMRGGGSIRIATHDYVVDPDQSAEHPLLPGAYVELVVTDTGIGMDEHTRAHAFEPFFTTKKLEGGTGLGLATVYGIVKQSGGHVAIESRPGAGATIRVLLPSAGSERPEPTLRPAEPAPQHGNERILLVDDDPMVRATSAALLENLGYTVLTAADGAEGLRVAEQDAGEIAVVITDIVMPQMGGVELARRLRARNPDAKIIFISGYSEEAALGRGALTDDRLLQKPFSVVELAAAVRAALDGEPMSIE